MSCLLLNPDDSEQMDLAVDLLRRAQPVALPSETVYGLAARLSSDAALSRVFALKARPHFDPLIVHVHDEADVLPLVIEITDTHRALMKAFWPGPLTILFKKNPARVSDLCTAGSDRVALRCPSHPVFRAALKRIGEPLAAPSANRFGRISPTSALDVVRELGPHGLEAVLDGGYSEHGVESTIVDVRADGSVELLRPGSIAREKIREVTGREVLYSAAGHARVVPGTVESHYAPLTRMHFVKEPESMAVPPEILADAKDWALLIVAPPAPAAWLKPAWGETIVLSNVGSSVEAAAKLFRVMRALDDLRLRGIVALKGPDSGLGLAINDRLRRAAGSH